MTILPTDAYLGDGLYAETDCGMIMLKAERENGVHFVGLEPQVFDQLIQFAIEIGWLKKGQVIK